jgi:hypothetical protein
MRNLVAKSTGLRRLSGKAGILSDVQNPTSGQVVEFDLRHTNKNKHILVIDGITLNATGAIVLEFRRASDGVWEQGAGAYQFKELRKLSATNPTTAANMPAGDYDGTSLKGVVVITGAGQAVPTVAISHTWYSDGEFHDLVMTNTDLHDRARLRVLGTEVFVSGAIYLTLLD